MKHTLKCAVVLMLSTNVLESPAQFYTAEKVGPAADTLSISTDPYVRDVLHETKPKSKAETKTEKRSVFGLPLPSFLTAKLGNKPPTSNNAQGKVQETSEKNFGKSSKKVVKQPVLPFLSTSDSLLLSILEKRLTICMPLDYLTVTSSYGYRQDPFTKCRRFHDGIDAIGINGFTYSMLPGRVAAVHHGSTGYGNYVIIDHGNLRCLYGHLSEVYAQEGAVVQAGTVVGLVGSTGRSTGPHLHLQLQRLAVNNSWASVDPMPFIQALNQQVESFNERLAEIAGKDTSIYNNVETSTKELTIENLYAALKRHGIKYPKIVLAQAILETGRFRSRVRNEHNNLFGLRHSKGYYSFNHWEESVIAYRDKVQYKHRENENYYSFLKRIGYSTSKDYVRRVREIVGQL
jgi:murein DD-endopeptidase MepM/ murein hydrolase activator NlpD